MRHPVFHKNTALQESFKQNFDFYYLVLDPYKSLIQQLDQCMLI